MALTFASYLETAELPPVDECVVFKGVIAQIGGESTGDADVSIATLGANYNDLAKANFEASGNYTPLEDAEVPFPAPEDCDADAEIGAYQSALGDAAYVEQFFGWCADNMGDATAGLCGPE